MVGVIDLVEKIGELSRKSELDAIKCDKGNRAAGVRLRKTLLEIMDTAKECRKVVIDQRG